MANILYVARTAEYFAQVVDLPWVVKQERLDELRDYMAAGENPDFDLATFQAPACGNTSNVGRLFNLPFRLSLGIHESVEPVIDEEATLAIYGAYKATEPLHPRPSRQGLRMQKIERAQSALGGALIEASMDRRRLDLIQEGFNFAKKEKLLYMSNRMTVKDAINLLSKT